MGAEPRPTGDSNRLYEDDYETLTPEGVGFHMLFKDRIRSAIDEYNLQHRKIHEVESMLCGVVYSISAELRRERDERERQRERLLNNNHGY